MPPWDDNACRTVDTLRSATSFLHEWFADPAHFPVQPWWEQAYPEGCFFLLVLFPSPKGTVTAGS